VSLLKAMRHKRVAASRIQRVWRGSKHRAETQTTFEQLSKVPGLVKGYQWRTRHFPDREYAVLNLQRLYRGIVSREATIQMLMRVVFIQAWWRGRMARVRYRRVQWAKLVILGFVFQVRYHKLVDAQLSINRGLRRAVKRNMPRLRRRRLNGKALILQRAQRGAACRRHLARRTAAASTLQAHVRGILSRKLAWKRFLAILKIQARMCGVLRRRQYVATRRKIVLIQTYTRRWLAYSQCCRLEGAAIEIQRMCRGIQTRRRLKAEKKCSQYLTRVVAGRSELFRYRRIHRAVCLIQRAVRCHLCRTRLRHRHDRAIKIEAWWRCCLAQRFFNRRRKAAGILIRASWMWRHRRLKRGRDAAAARIGAAWRGYCVRQNMRHLHRSADRIRRWWRTLAVLAETSKTVMELLRVRKTIQDMYRTQYIVKLQRRIRMWYGLKTGHRRTRRAVVALQAHWRRRKAAREVERLRRAVGPNFRRLPSQLVALMPDQWGRLTRYRAFRPGERSVRHSARIVRIKVLPQQLRWEVEDAICPLQAFVKHRRRCAALLRIQRHARGWLARHRIRKHANASTGIQAVWRQILAKRTVQHRRASLVGIQAWTRGTLARRRLSVVEDDDPDESEESLAEGDPASRPIGGSVLVADTQPRGQADLARRRQTAK